MGALIALVLMVTALLAAVFAVILEFSDSMYSFLYEKTIRILMCIAILTFLGSMAIVRIIEAGLWR